MDAVSAAAGARPTFPEVPEDTDGLATGGSAHRQRRLPRCVRPAAARIRLRVRAAHRLQPAAGAEPGQRQDHLRRRRRPERPRGASWCSAARAKRPSSTSLYLASLGGCLPGRRTRARHALPVRRRARHPGPGSCCGRCSTARLFCTSTEGGRIMLNIPGRRGVHLRRANPPRADAHRLASA